VAITDILTMVEAKAAVNLSPSSVGNDVAIQSANSAISELLDDLCGPVVVRSVTETVDIFGPLVFLTQWPVSLVTTVTEFSAGVGTALTAESTTVSGDYLERNGILSRRSSWSTVRWSGTQVTVVYTAGRYATTAVVGAKFKKAASEILTGNWQKFAAAWARGGDQLAEPVFFDEVSQTVARWLARELKPSIVG